MIQGNLSLLLHDFVQGLKMFSPGLSYNSGSYNSGCFRGTCPGSHSSGWAEPRWHRYLA